MPPSSPPRTLRLRRRRFPRSRPASAPYGYVDGVCWLGEDLLWVDGWMSEGAAEAVTAVRALLGGREYRCEPRVLVQEEEWQGARQYHRWIMALPVPGAGAARARLQGLSLWLPCGELLWHGARDRLIAADATRRLRVLTARPELPARIDAYLERLVSASSDNLRTDPLLARNLAFLRRAWADAGWAVPLLEPRPKLHVEAAMATPQGCLLVSGWSDGCVASARIVTRSGQSHALGKALLSHRREDLEDGDHGGDSLRAFVAVLALSGPPNEERPALCVAAGGGLSVVPLAVRIAPPSELVTTISAVVDNVVDADVAPGTAGRLLRQLAEAARAPRLEELAATGPRAEKPAVSQIVDLRGREELLEHHFVHGWRAGHVTRELLFCFRREVVSSGLLERLRQLAELYRRPARIFVVADEATWGGAMQALAEEAKGGILVFCGGDALDLDDGVERLVRVLDDEPAAAMALPAVAYFDGSLRCDPRAEPSGEPRLAPSVLQPCEVDAASPRRPVFPVECFALHRSLFFDVGGFDGRFFHRAWEAADLRRRVGARSSPIRATTATVVAISRGVSPGDARGSQLTERHDHDLLSHLGRSHAELQRARSVPRGGESSDGSGRRRCPAPSSAAAVSIVIPTYNPGPELAEVLHRIEGQECVRPFEVVVVDSGSTDGTLDLLRRSGVRRVDLPHRQYDHGVARQLGVEHARGQIVAFLSQDAMPEQGWLTELVAAFEDPSVAGAYSRQVPRPEASPFVVDGLAHWPATRGEPRRQSLDAGDDFEARSLSAKIESLCFDNVSSAVRRALMDHFPFRDVGFGADRDWAYRVLKAGLVIEYRPESRVVHSHDRSSWYELRRTFCDLRRLRELISAPAPMALGDALSWCRNETLRLGDLASCAPTPSARVRHRLRAPAVALARSLGAYLGVRAADRCPDGSRLWHLVTSCLERGV